MAPLALAGRGTLAAALAGWTSLTALAAGVCWRYPFFPEDPEGSVDVFGIVFVALAVAGLVAAVIEARAAQRPASALLSAMGGLVGGLLGYAAAPAFVMLAFVLGVLTSDHWAFG